MGNCSGSEVTRRKPCEGSPKHADVIPVVVTSNGDPECEILVNEDSLVTQRSRDGRLRVFRGNKTLMFDGEVIHVDEKFPYKETFRQTVAKAREEKYQKLHYDDNSRQSSATVGQVEQRTIPTTTHVGEGKMTHRFLGATLKASSAHR